MWAFVLPMYEGTIAIYGSFVLMIVVAARVSKSKFIEPAAIVLALLYVLSNFAWLFGSSDFMISLVPIINGAAAMYFFWQAFRKGAQHKAFHLVLAICQVTVLAMRYFHLLADVLPIPQGLSSNYWFTFIDNRIFDFLIIWVLVTARFRVHAMKDPNAWREKVLEFRDSMKKGEFFKYAVPFVFPPPPRPSVTPGYAMNKDANNDNETYSETQQSGGVKAATMDKVKPEKLSLEQHLRRLLEEIATDD